MSIASMDTVMEKIGSHRVSRDMLHQIPTPTREDVGMGDRWQPIQHGLVADAVVEAAGRAGLKVTGETWSASSKGLKLHGYLNLDLPKFNKRGTLPIKVKTYGGFKPEIVDRRLGIVNANDGSKALYMAVMDVVKICSNGMTVEQGTFAVKRKHTTGFDIEELPELLDTGVIRYLEQAQQIGQEIDAMQAIDLSSETEVNDLLIEAGRTGVISWSKLGKVDKAWREPPHKEFKDRNAWSFYNAFTEVARTQSPREEMRIVSAARQLILN